MGPLSNDRASLLGRCGIIVPCPALIPCMLVPEWGREHSPGPHQPFSGFVSHFSGVELSGPRSRLVDLLSLC